MGNASRAFTALMNIVSANKSQGPAPDAKRSTWQAKGIMFVSKPRGAVDDIVRTAENREEAQKLAKTSAMIVENKSKFLPRSGVSVRTRLHVIFEMKDNDTSINALWASETEELTMNVSVQSDNSVRCEARASQNVKEMKPKKRAEYVATIGQAIRSLSLLNLTEPKFKKNVEVLERVLPELLKVAREKIDEVQAPIEENIATTATMQKNLDLLPKGAFVVHCTGPFNRIALLAIYEGLEPLKRGQRVYALTPKHSEILTQCLSTGSAHARLAAMRLLGKVPDDHPAALTDEALSAFTEFKTDGNVLARLESLIEMTEEEKIGEVFMVEPRMIDTYSSYRLPYGFKYGECWSLHLEKRPLVLSKNRSSLKNRPPADLITLDGILCVSDAAKAVLEQFDLGNSKFHKIQETDDYWAIEITEYKPGPIPDEDLYQLNKDGKRQPRPVGGKQYFSEGLPYLAKRVRFDSAALEEPKVWLCEDLVLNHGNSPAVVFSKDVITALKKAKCKWYKPVRAASVIDG